MDTIRNGYNGYRIHCTDIKAGVNAVEKIDAINPHDLRNAGLYYSRDIIALKYDEYIQYIYNKSKGINSTKPSYHRSWESENIEWPEEWTTPVDNHDNKSDD